MKTPPEPGEYAAYYQAYTSQVPAGDIREVLGAQAGDFRALLRGISDQRSMHRYAPGKWTIREVASHVNDTERVFTFRAFWFARGLAGELPSFDQDAAIPMAAATDRSWAGHIEEFEAIRSATLAFWRSLPDEAWNRRGVASGNPFTVRSLAWITAGHVAHHARLLHQLYLP